MIKINVSGGLHRVVLSPISISIFLVREELEVTGGTLKLPGRARPGLDIYTRISVARAVE